MEILTHTSGDVEEALDWMDQVDKGTACSRRNTAGRGSKDERFKHGLLGVPTKVGDSADQQGRGS
ncbi:MAG: hypothetical protein IPH00_15970 [Flavobacteriales bacterium]|nr:hypothetical protein [Flavobacteriales bacterium]